MTTDFYFNYILGHNRCIIYRNLQNMQYILQLIFYFTTEINQSRELDYQNTFRLEILETMTKC